MEHIHIRASSHQPNPNQNWACDIQGFPIHISSIYKHENEVTKLQQRQKPNLAAWNAYEPERASRYEDTNLVAEIENGEILGYCDALVVGILLGHFLAHDVGEGSDDGVLEEIDGEKVED